MFILFDKPIECVAFDLEGTVINLESFHHQAHIYAAGQVGLTLNMFDLPHITRLIENFIGGPDEIIAEQIYEHSNKSLLPKEILTLDSYYFQKLLQTKSNIEPREGFLQIYKIFHDKDIPMALGTLASRETADYILNKSGLNNLFPVSNVVQKEEIIRYKPAPDIWYETARKMNKKPESQLIFDDAPKGIAAAIISHSTPIGMPVYDDPEIQNELSKAGSVKIYQHWNEINELISGKTETHENNMYIQNYLDILGKLDMKKINYLKNKINLIRGTDRTIFVCGNGGSSATASHMACDLGINLSRNMPANSRFRVICLNENIPVLTAIANDVGYDAIFAEQLKNLGRKGDLLIVLSGSGNSENIISTVRVAKENGIETFGLLGFMGGKVKTLLDNYIIIPSNNYGYIENSHNVIEHLLTDNLSNKHLGKNNSNRSVQTKSGNNPRNHRRVKKS